MNDTYTDTEHKKYDFLERIYGTLFYPRETFEELKKSPPVIEALAIVIAVSILTPLINTPPPSSQAMGWFIFTLINAGISGIIKWLFFAAFVELIAAIFKRSGHFKTFITLSGFALLPWIFIGPITLLKTGGIIAGLTGVLAGLAIWLWATILTIFAAMKTYEISSNRVLLLVIIPFLGGIIFFNWIIGFFETLIQIMKI